MRSIYREINDGPFPTYLRLTVNCSMEVVDLLGDFKSVCINWTPHRYIIGILERKLEEEL